MSNSMKMSAILIGLALASLGAGQVQARAHARAEQCRPTTVPEIHRLFDRWNDSLKTGDAARVVDENYVPNSVLLATIANEPRITRDEKIDYFRRLFLPKKPVGKIVFSRVEIDCTTAFDTGLYDFSYADGTSTKARYTFTYKWTGMKWLISSHHSSAMPIE